MVTPGRRLEHAQHVSFLKIYFPSRLTAVASRILKSLISLKNITSEVKFAERKSALLQNNTCAKNSAFYSVLQGNPAVASPKEQLYEQMTSNPAFAERNYIQKANAYQTSTVY